MYEAFFKFNRRPFAAAADPQVCFESASLVEARDSLTRCIERAAGPAMLVGPAGTGKTLLLSVLAEYFRGTFRVALLASGRLASRRALLQAVLYELRLPFRNMEEGELRLSLIDHVAPSQDCPLGLLLLIDEAHTLPLSVLEEIRLITNLVRDGEPRVRLVLAGSPALEERFTNPRLESFNQRLAARCFLQPLTRDETHEYVRWQLRQAGGDPRAILTDEALQTIYTSTQGVPRLINQLCDHALILASLGGHKRLDESGIAEAWADLQQLPLPVSNTKSGAAPTAQTADSVIEFGGLDEEPAESTPPTVPFRPAAKSRASGDPTHRLDQLQEQIARLDSDEEIGALKKSPAAVVEFGESEDLQDEEEFRPAGTIGPEVEVVFTRTDNPFEEIFASEEVVIDRYAALQERTPRRLPRVSSREGHELSALLEKHLGTEKPAAEKQAAERGTPAADSVAVSHADPSRSTEVGDPPRGGVHSIEPSTFDPDVVEPDDRDLIVIDDVRVPATAVAAADKPPTGRARRMEYSQLFAKLRRGSG